MIFAFCIRCGMRISVGDELAGGQVQCPFCGAVTRVPAIENAPGPMTSPTDAPENLAPVQNRPNSYAPWPQPINYMGAPPPPRGPSQQHMAIAGLVLAFFFAPLGLLCSCIALDKMKTFRNDQGKGLAIAGMVIGIVFCAVWCGMCTMPRW